MIYTEHVSAISDRIYKILKDTPSAKDYDPFDDEACVSQVIYGETESYGISQGWYGSVKNRYDKVCEDLTFAASQMIAGASPSIELSFDGQYRKDMFRDVALGALYHDIYLELKNRHPTIECYSFCERGN